jgi:hypothetical protein
MIIALTQCKENQFGADSGLIQCKNDFCDDLVKRSSHTENTDTETLYIGQITVFSIISLLPNAMGFIQVWLKKKSGEKTKACKPSTIVYSIYFYVGKIKNHIVKRFHNYRTSTAHMLGYLL